MASYLTSYRLPCEGRGREARGLPEALPIFLPGLPEGLPERPAVATTAGGQRLAGNWLLPAQIEVGWAKCLPVAGYVIAGGFAGMFADFLPESLPEGLPEWWLWWDGWREG